MMLFKNLIFSSFSYKLLLPLGILLSCALQVSGQTVARCKESRSECQYILFEHYSGFGNPDLTFTRADTASCTTEIRKTLVSRYFCFFKKKFFCPIQKWVSDQQEQRFLEITMKMSATAHEVIYIQEETGLANQKVESYLRFVKGDWNKLILGEEVELLETRESLRKKRKEEQKVMIKHLLFRAGASGTHSMLRDLLSRGVAYLDTRKAVCGECIFKKVRLLRWKAIPIRLFGTRDSLHETSGKRELFLKLST